MIYFASDFHLGAPNHAESLEREKKIVGWLEKIAPQAQEIYLMGDVFDFWFEYRTVVPKYFTRLLGCIARLTDAGLPVHYFTGNHDLWTFGYLEQELGVILHREPVIKTLGGAKFYLAHGDGLGPHDAKYKLMKKAFVNPNFQWILARFHPNFTVRLANHWSESSRKKNRDSKVFLGAEEWLYQYCFEVLKTEPDINYFIFGHRHLPIDVQVSENARYLNTGDWINYDSFVSFDGNNAVLEYYKF